MHVPDGFLDAPTSVATGVVAVAGVAVCLRKARAELDGGLTALGTNIVLMSFVTCAVAYAVLALARRVLPATRAAVVGSAFVAALVSVPVSSFAFTGLYAVGGTVGVPIGTLATAMIGVHVLIGLGEAAITALTVSSLLATRPDLVHAARHLTTYRPSTAQPLGGAA